MYSDDDEDDDPNNKIPIPMYLRKGIDYIRVHEDTSKNEIGLKHITRLVQMARPLEIDDLAVDLTSTLLYAQNPYDLDGFWEYRNSAMIVALVRCPYKVIPYVHNDLFMNVCSLNDTF